MILISTGTPISPPFVTPSTRLSLTQSGEHSLSTKPHTGNLSHYRVPSYPRAQMSQLSEVAKEFISSLLQLDSSARMSAKAALAHPWQRHDQRDQHDQHDQHEHLWKRHEHPFLISKRQHANNHQHDFRCKINEHAVDHNMSTSTHLTYRLTTKHAEKNTKIIFTKNQQTLYSELHAVKNNQDTKKMEEKLRRPCHHHSVHESETGHHSNSYSRQGSKLNNQESEKPGKTILSVTKKILHDKWTLFKQTLLQRFSNVRKDCGERNSVLLK